jgi:hypothetical protein
MCNIYDLVKPLVGSSGKLYCTLESLKDVEDIFGRDLLMQNNTWVGESSFAEQIDGDFCLCYLNTVALLEQGNLKENIDFKLDWQNWDEIT